MDKIIFKCEKCGADLKAEDGRRFSFCPYCGGETKKEEKLENTEESSKEDAEVKVRLAELEIEKEKNRLRGTLIKVWIFIVVVLAGVAIEILIKDKDNSNSLGYTLLLIDINAVMWPAVFLFGNKKNKRK